ncbi:MAG: hypothetical protein FWC80_05140, partial [Firmicutes bacterium]|nr:hypothetical protein [Bacillota bacterium]
CPYANARHNTKPKPIKNNIEKIVLLYLASHEGRKISKPTLLLSVYLSANIVSGHRHLHINNLFLIF